MHPRLLDEVFSGAYATLPKYSDFRIINKRGWYGICPEPAFGRAEVGFWNTEYFHYGPGGSTELQSGSRTDNTVVG